MRLTLPCAMLAATLLSSPSIATPAATDSTAMYTIVGDQVVIYGVATVRVDELKQAVDRVRAAAHRGGLDAARAELTTMPDALARAAVWEMTTGVEDDNPPERDIDRQAGGTDPEPPVQAGEPERTVQNVQSANYTAPTVVCTWYNATDRRQMNSILFRVTLYKFHIDVTWRGCDNATHGSPEPFMAWYSDIDIIWSCDNDAIIKESGPFASTPWVKHFASGTCGAGLQVGDRGVTLGRQKPYINNTYDWQGHRTVREGSAH